jgi:hypothetical protein
MSYPQTAQITKIRQELMQLPDSGNRFFLICVICVICE